MTTPASGESATSPDPDPAYAASFPQIRLPAGRSRRAQAGRAVLAACIAAATACCLAAGVLASAHARTQRDRLPTAAERSAAAAVAVAQRWRTWAAGRIFPAGLSYPTQVGTRETARRAGIAAGSACAAAMDAALARQAARYGCRAALRATYADELQGVIYTAGILVFARPSRAAAFLGAVASQLRRRDSGPGAGRGAGQVAGDRRPDPGDFSVVMTEKSPRYGLRAHVVAGTAAARFGSAARQVMTGRQQGVYVVLTVAGYADGRPAVPARNPRRGIFRPATALAAGILGPLTAPPEVSCARPEWRC
jgi:hypothetical protein